MLIISREISNSRLPNVMCQNHFPKDNNILVRSQFCVESPVELIEDRVSPGSPSHVQPSTHQLLIIDDDASCVGSRKKLLLLIAAVPTDLQ